MMMHMPFAFFCTTIGIFLVIRDKIISWTALIFALGVAIYHGNLQFIGLVPLAVFAAICHVYFQNKNLNKASRFLLFWVVIACTIPFMLHMVPGIVNDLMIDQVQVSKISTSFTMYYNFDKAAAGLIILATSGLYLNEKPVDSKTIGTVFRIFVVTMAMLVPAGIAMGYLVYDPKFPDVFNMWAANNLLFVAFFDEVFFRGFLQNTIKSLFQARYKLHIIASSLIYGSLYYKAGIEFMILAIIAGWFYGYTYEKTNRITCAMALHFLVNLVHFIFFAYPAATAMSV